MRIFAFLLTSSRLFYRVLTLSVSDDLNTFHPTSLYLRITLFGVLAVVLTLCHLNHIRLLLLLLLLLLGLISDTALSGCNRGGGLLYLWTAGYVAHDSSNTRQWKLHSVLRGSNSVNLWVENEMSFTYWGTGQPDNHGGNEHCVNIWPSVGYEWNDQTCDSRFCFVCENRNIDV